MCLIFPVLSGIIKYKLLLCWIEVQFTRHLYLDSLFSFTRASKGMFKQLMNYGLYYYHLFQTAPFFSFLSAHFLQWYFSFLCRGDAEQGWATFFSFPSPPERHPVTSSISPLIAAAPNSGWSKEQNEVEKCRFWQLTWLFRFPAELI